MKKFSLMLFVAFLMFSNASFSMSNIGAPISEPVNAVAPDAVKFAFQDFMNLTRHERKLRINAVKSELKAFKAAKRAGDNVSTNQVLLVILAILLPPLAVYLHEGAINSKFWLDLLLTLLFFIPGVIYALIVVLGH